MPRPGDEFQRLVDIMARLRAPNGCPWDLEQDFHSLRKYLLEETYEVLDCIDRKDWPGLAEELGDLLLQPVFQAQMAKEAGYFTIANALEAINDKLIRRHPHIFGDATAETAGEVKRRWDEIKADEKASKGETATDLLAGVPRALPALVEGQKIGSKVAAVGFDWPDVSGVLQKLHEELDEIDEARTLGDREKVEEEVGDLLFVVVNLARKLGIDAEQALRGANAKFRRRFQYVERSLASEGRSLEAASLEEMEAKWLAAKEKL
jgi:MazG family protein